MLVLVYKTNVLYKLQRHMFSNLDLLTQYLRQEDMYLLLTVLIRFTVFLFRFVRNRKHLLLTLLTLEGLILMVFCLLSLTSLHWAEIPVFILIFLTLVACEGALGLSLLVSVIRTHGRDHVNSLNSL